MNHSDVGSIVCKNNNIICSTFIINRFGDLQRTEKMIIENPKPIKIQIKRKEKEPINSLFLIKIFSNLIEKQKEK
jgi:hypothetical protein